MKKTLLGFTIVLLLMISEVFALKFLASDNSLSARFFKSLAVFIRSSASFRFLDNSSSSEKNYRNGYNKKNVKTEYGDISVNMPRDRNGEFNPEFLPKREILSDGIKNQITSFLPQIQARVVSSSN